jgi:hypothetical protein
VGEAMFDVGTMTHLSVRACAATACFRERAQQAKASLGTLEITGAPVIAG